MNKKLLAGAALVLVLSAAVLFLVPHQILRPARREISLYGNAADAS